MAPRDGAEMSPEAQHAWLTRLLEAAQTSAADVRAKNSPQDAALLQDLDDLCIRLRREIAAIKLT
jgi:hypothetical protein